MSSDSKKRATVIIGLAVAVFSWPGIIGAGIKYLSPAAITSDNQRNILYIAGSTAGEIILYDMKADKIIKTWSLPGNPSGLVLSAGGDRLYVTEDSADGRVFVVDTSSGKIIKEISVGHTPRCPVLSPDGKTLYVCNQFNNNVSLIDTQSGRERVRIPVVREPVASAVTPEGKWLYVANLLPGGAADTDYDAAMVSVIDTVKQQTVSEIELPNGSNSLEGLCISPDGKYVYVTHILARYQTPTTQLERGWMNTNALSIIATAGNKLVNTVLLDDVDHGAANPHAVICSADGERIYIALSGTHELTVIDRPALHERLERVTKGQKVCGVSSPDDVPDELSFLLGIKQRIKLKGIGPRGLTVEGTKIYVTEYFSDSLGIIDCTNPGQKTVRSVALGPRQAQTTARKGEMFFHDASLCFQEWQSCSSCHPGGARTDALNWDLLNDGIGNPKNTKSLLLAHRTPPAMARGVRKTAEAAVRAGIKHIQFAVRPEADARAIDEYLQSLKPLKSPYLANGGAAAAIKRGEKVFVQSGCSHCHNGPYYTNKKQYNVGTGKGREKDVAFDTPTLVEVWRTAPYLHDGRATTIKEVFTKYNPHDKHGKTSQLNNHEISDLVLYVLTR